MDPMTYLCPLLLTAVSLLMYPRPRLPLYSSLLMIITRSIPTSSDHRICDAIGQCIGSPETGSDATVTAMVSLAP